MGPFAGTMTIPRGQVQSTSRMSGYIDPDAERNQQIINARNEAAKKQAEQSRMQQLSQTENAAIGAATMANPLAGAAVGAAVGIKNDVVGMVKGAGTAAKWGLAGIGGAFAATVGAGKNAASSAHEKVTGLYLPFVLCCFAWFYDVRNGFPRGSDAGASIATGLYLFIGVVLFFVYHQDIVEIAKAIGLQIFLPCIIKIALILPFAGFLSTWKQPITWGLVLITPVIWYIFERTDMPRDTVMRWSGTVYKFALLLLLFPLFLTFFNSHAEASGISTGRVDTLTTLRDIRDQEIENLKKFGVAITEFIPNMVKSATEPVQEAPAGTGSSIKIGLTVPPGTANMPPQFGKVSMDFNVNAPEAIWVEAEVGCKVRKVDSQGNAINEEDERWGTSNFKTISDGKVKISSSKTFSCEVNQEEDVDRNDNALVEFGAIYKTRVVASYTTYFVEQKLSEDGTLVQPYTRDEFFAKTGLRRSPVSEASASTCFVSIDNNNIDPPIYISEDNDKIPFKIGITAKSGGDGTTLIDSVDSLVLTLPKGLSKPNCGDPSLFSPGSNPQEFVFDKSRASELSGKQIVLSCEADVNKNELISIGDYAQGTFKVSAECSMFNKNSVRVRFDTSKNPLGASTTGADGSYKTFSTGMGAEEKAALDKYSSIVGVPQNVAYGIAMIENGGSHWYSNNHVDSNVRTGDSGNSIGMMQINTASGAHPDCAGTIKSGACFGATSCVGKTLRNLDCNVEAGLRFMKQLYGSKCTYYTQYTGWDAAAGNYNGCCNVAPGNKGSCSSSNYVSNFKSSSSTI